MVKMFGIFFWDDLLDGLKKVILLSFVVWYDCKFKMLLGKYEFKFELVEKNGYIVLLEYKLEVESKLFFYLFMLYVQFGLYLLFINLDWMQVFYLELFVYIYFFFVKRKGISENDLVKVFNGIGEVELWVKVIINVLEDFLVMYEVWFLKWQYNV